MEINESIIKDEFHKYQFFIVQEFIQSFMSAPIAGKCKFVQIRTSENISFSVWGRTLEEIWEQFQRFLKLRIFV